MSEQQRLKEKLPVTLDPKHVQEILHIGRRQVYELMERAPFKVLRVGKLYKVPKEAFFTWYEGEETDEN